ncbi:MULTISPECIES: (2Fe-2S)-binding protein [unclassified Thioclava]|uniref:(2Fe-2S)-binding protein n=1 Tax=unclassified Thioclava TaxID=2621713 RepID=UPI0009963C80|nr:MULTISPECIES: (2Fe-2S)-binding protein [unclassified Thioclava]MPQ92563.1 (2Fe-2S)-binding protein [Thioclava sp. JE_KL1]OOY18124.1 (2Fe-2S)-binding protein [Thioclava sp. DLFJ4-1]
MKLKINGKSVDVQSGPDTPLLWVIRDELGMTGTKFGCGIAQCGACSVLLDGMVQRSCVLPVSAVGDSEVTTIEEIENDPVGKRVVEAWVDKEVPQCGYCQSGQVMAATSLLKSNDKPTEDDITAAMTNLCRCGTYNAINDTIASIAGTDAAKAGDAQ